MSGFTRYILRQLFVGMILVSTGLTCIIWLSQSLRFVEMIVNRGLTAGTFLYLTMLLMPNFLSIILPIALFTVIVFVYAKMISDRELVVMRAAGLSQYALAKPALIMVAIVMTVSYSLNLYLLPESYRMFRELQWDIRYNYSHVLLKEGAFNQVAQGITVYVRERSADGQLHGILVHDQRKPEKPFTLMAERGAMVDTEDGARVVMYTGNRQEVDTSNNKLSILYFDRYVFDLAGERGGSPVRYREPRERGIYELWHLDQAAGINPIERGKYVVELHKRLASPWVTLGLALVGLACLISGSFSRRAQTQQVVLAVGIMVALQGSALGIENVAAKRTELVPLIYLHTALPVVFGALFTLRHFNFRRRTAEAAA